MVTYTEWLTCSGAGVRFRKRVMCKLRILMWKELDFSKMTGIERYKVELELYWLQSLRHPNIVRYYYHFMDQSKTKLYIVMEHCEGGDLASLITRCFYERSYLEEQFIIKVTAQLTLALNECHSKSFLDIRQNVKLGHFGPARIPKRRNIFAKTFVGTPYDMSPELINRQPYNEKTDIWSLGCLLPPFMAHDRKELTEKIKDGRYGRVPYRYSEELNSLIGQMLNTRGYLRPSVESILQSSLLADAVAEEQRRAQVRVRRRSDLDQLKGHLALQQSSDSGSRH